MSAENVRIANITNKAVSLLWLSPQTPECSIDDLIQAVPAAIGTSSAQVVAITETADYSEELLNGLVKSIVTTKQGQLIYGQVSPRFLIFNREVWQLSANCFQGKTLEELFANFANAVTATRKFYTFEFNCTPQLETAPAARTRELTAETFRALDTVLSPSVALDSTAAAQAKMGEDEIIASIDMAVQALRENQDQTALVLLNQVIPLKLDMPHLYYARAIAEVRLGKSEEAIQSLNALLIRDPSYAPGKELLEKLQDSR